jgi:hypothetical protein
VESRPDFDLDMIEAFIFARNQYHSFIVAVFC